MPLLRLHRLLRRLGLIAALPVLTGAVWLSAAGPTFACSCAESQPMAAYGTPDNAVFAGTAAGALDARGVPVKVTTWYHGPGAAPLVYLAKGSFGESSMCGVSPPVVGSGWIWVTWVGVGSTDPQTSLCSPAALLDTPEGNAMVADAVATFGGALPPGAEPGSAEPAPRPIVPADAAVLVLVATVVVGVVLFGVVAALARRRTRSA